MSSGVGGASSGACCGRGSGWSPFSQSNRPIEDRRSVRHVDVELGAGDGRLAALSAVQVVAGLRDLVLQDADRLGHVVERPELELVDGGHGRAAAVTYTHLALPAK